MDEYEYEDKKRIQKEIEKLLSENVYIQKFSATCKKFFVSIAVKIEGYERYQEFLFS